MLEVIERPIDLSLSVSLSTCTQLHTRKKRSNFFPLRQFSRHCSEYSKDNINRNEIVILKLR